MHETPKGPVHCTRQLFRQARGGGSALWSRGGLVRSRRSTDAERGGGLTARTLRQTRRSGSCGRGGGNRVSQTESGEGPRAEPRAARCQGSRLARSLRLVGLTRSRQLPRLCDAWSEGKGGERRPRTRRTRAVLGAACARSSGRTLVGEHAAAVQTKRASEWEEAEGGRRERATRPHCSRSPTTTELAGGHCCMLAQSHSPTCASLDLAQPLLANLSSSPSSSINNATQPDLHDLRRGTTTARTSTTAPPTVPHRPACLLPCLGLWPGAPWRRSTSGGPPPLLSRKLCVPLRRSLPLRPRADAVLPAEPDRPSSASSEQVAQRLKRLVLLRQLLVCEVRSTLSFLPLGQLY